MKIATTIGEMYAFTSSPAEAIRQYEGTGFKYLDYSFYTVLRPGDPFMSDAWKDRVLEAKETAGKLGFQFVQAHAPCCEVIGGDTERELEATIRSIEICKMLGIRNTVVHNGYKAGLTKEEWFSQNKAFYEKYFIPVKLSSIVHSPKASTYLSEKKTGRYSAKFGDKGLVYSSDFGSQKIFPSSVPSES